MARCKPPIMAELRSMLMRTPEEGRGYVIPSLAKSYAASTQSTSALITAHFAKYGIETSVTGRDGRKRPDATAYSFRHTFISKCGNAGVPLAIVQGWVGHMSKNMKENYFHESDTATLMCAAQIPALPAVAGIAATDAPQAIPHAGAQQLTERGVGEAGHGHSAWGDATMPPDSAGAAENRHGVLCSIFDGMTADELKKVRAEIDNRLGIIEV